MRRVLMLAYRYPPCRAHPTAAARAAGFAANLGGHGWAPTVLTPALPAGACGSPGCTHDEPPPLRDVPQHQVGVRMLRRAAWRDRLPASAPARRLASATLATRRLHHDWPDAAVAAARQLHAQAPFAAVWVTAGPFAQIDVGRRAADALGTPWVADLRDPVSRVLGGSSLHLRLEPRRRRSDARALTEAAAVVHATQGFADEDASWGVPSHATIRSGFDRRTWERVRAVPRSRPGRFELLYVGRFYRERGPGALVELIAEVLRGDPAARSDLRLVYRGPTPGPLQRAAEVAGVADVVELRPSVAPGDVPAVLRAATVNVLLTNDLGIPDWPGGKFYDLVAAGRPMLVLPDLADWVSDTVRGRGLGEAVGGAVDGATAIAGRLRGWRATGDLPDVADLDDVADLSIQAATGRLAELLDEVVAPRGGGGAYS